MWICFLIGLGLLDMERGIELGSRKLVKLFPFYFTPYTSGHRYEGQQSLSLAFVASRETYRAAISRLARSLVSSTYEWAPRLPSSASFWCLFCTSTFV